MNSVHEQCPNSDLKQCTASKLGRVHSAHTQNSVASAQHVVVRATARITSLSRAQSLSRARAGRDTPRQSASVAIKTPNATKQPKLCHDTKFCIATPLWLNHVATHLPLNHVATQKMCRDTNFWSQPPKRPTHFPTSKPCCDTTFSK